MLDWLFADPLLPGTPAPDFSLPDQDGRIVSLTALRGHYVVLIFYPGDDTSVCRRQLCEFRDRWATAQQKNTLIFGVNPQSAQSHAQFIAKSRLPFPLDAQRVFYRSRPRHLGPEGRGRRFDRQARGERPGFIRDPPTFARESGTVSCGLGRRRQ